MSNQNPPKTFDNIKLINYTGKELHFYNYKNDNQVINILKTDDQIILNKDSYTNQKTKILNINNINNENYEFSITVLNNCPLNKINLPPFQYNLYYVTTPLVAHLLKRIDVIYPDDIFSEDEFHIYFRSFKCFHY